MLSLPSDPEPSARRRDSPRHANGGPKMRYLSKVCNYRRAAAGTRVFHLECALHHVRWSRHIVRLHEWVGPSLFRDRRGRPMTWIHLQLLGQRIEPCETTPVERALGAECQVGAPNAE